MPADRTRVLQQAQLFASRGQYEAAIAEWKKLAIDAPTDGSIYNSIGDLQLKRNAQPEAATAFLQAASAFRAEGAVLKAIAAFKKVLKCDPSRYEVYRHLGDLNAERGLVSSAVQDYQTLGKYYLKERRGKDALEVYKKIVSYDPSNLSAQQRVAELCVQENLQDEATKVYLQLGRERSAQGRYDEAKDAYLAVLRIDPANSEAVQFVDSLQKNNTGAIKAVKPNAATPVAKPSEPLDLLAEATRRIEEKQYAGAEAILNQMLTREPGNPQVCQLLARLHLQRGDVQIALGEYRFLAGAALRAHEFPSAEALIQEFLTAQPDSVPIIELYGELCEEKGEASAAAMHYAKAVELLLEHPEPGMESLHEELFDKVRSLSPDQELINRLAARVKGESSAKSGGASAEATTQEQPASQMTAALGEGGSPLAVDKQSDTRDSHQGGQDFSLVGAEPDTMEGFVEERSAESGNGLIHETQDEPFVQEHPIGAETQLTATEQMVGGGEGGLHTHPEDSQLQDQTVTANDPTRSPASMDLSRTGQERRHESAVAATQEHSSASDAPTAQPTVTVQSNSVESAAKLPDYEAYYTLGVAYKNMGLYEEAKASFQVSLKADTFYLDSALMTALCFKEQQQLTPAIFGIEAVLADPRCQGAKGQAIRYELGLLYEAVEQWEKAAHAFQAIPSFHDVPQRLAALKGKYSGGEVGFRYAS